MKTILFILLLPLAALLPGKELQAQVFAIKSWNGLYPDMQGTYPLYFMAFKGWPIPTPHEFIRIWPTHYYFQVVSMPTYDLQDYSSELKVSFLRIVAKQLEKSQMKKRQEETQQIKNNTEIQRDIEKKIFDSNSDQLPDVYSIASGFIRLYTSIDNMDKLDHCKWLRQTFQKEADELLTRFIAVNLFLADHGKKLEAFEEIKLELNKQIGEADYTYRKVRYFQTFNAIVPQSYAFLKE